MRATKSADASVTASGVEGTAIGDPLNASLAS